MTTPDNRTLTEAEFNALVDKEVSLTEANLQEKIHIAVIGKVSCGKSSFLNAFFNKKKGDTLPFEVGALSGITTTAKTIQINDDIIVSDLPGLNDNNQQNSQVTINALKDVDIGILIVTGSSDKSQKDNYDLLKKHCKLVYVVLNKVDEYKRKPKSLEEVTAQWHADLNLSPSEKIWHACCEGYDPNDEGDDLNLQGITELRDDILQTAFTQHGIKEKALKLTKELEGKSAAAKKAVIMGVIGAVTAAFIPGPSAAYITATQIGAILGIHFAYTDKVMTKTAAGALVAFFAGQAAVSTTFLWAISIFPVKAGVGEIAAAVTAFTITLPMLVSINWMYKTQGSLDNKDELKAKFNQIKTELNNINKKEIMKKAFTGNWEPLKKVINQFLG